MTKKKKEEIMRMEDRFSKSQIVNSRRFKDSVDLLNSILRDDKEYTLQEVEEKIQKFKKGRVK